MESILTPNRRSTSILESRLLVSYNLDRQPAHCSTHLIGVVQLERLASAATSRMCPLRLPPAPAIIVVLLSRLASHGYT